MNKNESSNKNKLQSIEETQGIKAVDTFQQLQLKQNLLRGIYGYGFEKPSIIQQKGILPLIKKSDTIVQAQSGTGKTATYCIGILQLLDPNSSNCQALILAPTRQLAQQIQRVMKCLGQYEKIVTHCCIGGTDIHSQRKKLKQDGIHILIGTPGRVSDLMTKSYIKTQHMKIMILDEADQMLGFGFHDQLKQIFSMVPSDIQVGLFSATLQKQIIDISLKFLRNPTKILVNKQQLTLDGIKQFYISIDKQDWKFDTLVQLYKNIEIGQCMIFVNKKQRVEDLSKKLSQLNFVVSKIHGEIGMLERQVVMRQFRTGSSRVLITTDLLSRGIDIQQVNLIINYDLPLKKENYIHRIGRSGRFGRRGVAINFVTPSDAKFIVQIRQYFNTQISELPLELSQIYTEDNKI